MTNFWVRQKIGISVYYGNSLSTYEKVLLYEGNNESLNTAHVSNNGTTSEFEDLAPIDIIDGNEEVLEINEETNTPGP